MNIPHWAEMGISKIFEKEAQRRFGGYLGGDNTKNEGKPTSILTGQFQCVCQCSTLFFYLSAVFTALKLKKIRTNKSHFIIRWRSRSRYCVTFNQSLGPKPSTCSNPAACCQLISAINGQFLEQHMPSILFNSKHSFCKVLLN